MRSQDQRSTFCVPLFLSVALLLLACPSVGAQSAVTTVMLSKDQVGEVKTAPAITTRLSFPEEVKQIVCGDLYDKDSGRGTFVIQRSGNDVFLKPVVPKGASNLFVKVGESPGITYVFKLTIVPVAQAHLVINIVNPQPPATVNTPPPAAANATPAPAPPPVVKKPPLITPPALESIDAPPAPANLANSQWDGEIPVESLSSPPAPEIEEASPPAATETRPRVLRTMKVVQLSPKETLDLAIKRVLPPYPQHARSYSITGAVTVEVTINEQGKVIAARALSGPPFLIETAITAAKQWTFQPANGEDDSLRSVGTIIFNFRNDERRR